MNLEIADRIALSELVDRYAALVDDGDFSGAADLFTEDAVLRQPRPPHSLEPTDEVCGREALVHNFGQLRALRATQHAVVGRLFGADAEDRATGRIACIAHHVSGDATLVDHAWHLTYLDRYRRVDGRWLIAERILRLHWIERRPVSAPRSPTQ